MLIINRREKLTKGKIVLPNWIRAPLALNDSNTTYYIFDPEPAISGMPLVELLCTPFDTKHWNDLWRIELETEDAPGNISGLVGILTRNNIQILMSEGSINTNGRLHEMSFIISCIDYRSEIDKDSNFRSSEDQVQLVDLFDQISVELIEKINFSADGSPKLKIRRLSHYHSLHKRYQQSITDTPGHCTIKRGAIIVSEDVVDRIRNALQLDNNADVWYTTAVDTKDRIIRVLLFGETERPIGHLQILCPNRIELLDEIFKLLAGQEKSKEDAKINIIRFQIRSGVNKLVKGLENTVPGEPIRIDLTFVPQRPWKSSHNMHYVLTKRIYEIPNFKLKGGRVLVGTGARDD